MFTDLNDLGKATGLPQTIDNLKSFCLGFRV